MAQDAISDRLQDLKNRDITEYRLIRPRRRAEQHSIPSYDLDRDPRKGWVHQKSHMSAVLLTFEACSHRSSHPIRQCHSRCQGRRDCGNAGGHRGRCEAAPRKAAACTRRAGQEMEGNESGLPTSGATRVVPHFSSAPSRPHTPKPRKMSRPFWTTRTGSKFGLSRSMSTVRWEIESIASTKIANTCRSLAGVQANRDRECRSHRSQRL